MERVLPAPVVVGRERQHAGDETPDVIGRAGLEERSVTAVVEDDEDPDEHPAGQDHQGQSEPVGNRKAEVQEIPEDEVGPDRVHDLPAGPPDGGHLVLGHEFLPLRDLGPAVLPNRIDFDFHHEPLSSSRPFDSKHPGSLRPCSSRCRVDGTRSASGLTRGRESFLSARRSAPGVNTALHRRSPESASAPGIGTSQA